MMLGFLLVTALVAGSPAATQQAVVSSLDVATPAADGVSQTTAPAAATQPAAATPEDGPHVAVSLDHIRERLEKPAPLTIRFEAQPDFRTEVIEQQKLDDFIKSLDFRGGPVPPGGLYQYEQQRQVFNPTNYPLMQNYATFSPGELATLTIESLIQHLVGKRLFGAIGNAERVRAEAAARAEVMSAIADYCAAQPENGAGIKICENPQATR